MENEGCVITSSNPHALACMEIWGGNRKVAAGVELPGLSGWVYCRPVDESKGGGDLHYLSVCDKGVLSRVLLADVRGHGPAVSSLAGKLHGLMRQYINTWNQAELMRELNDHFQGGLPELEYATAVVLGYYRPDSMLTFTNAGHPPPLRYHAADNSWNWLEESAAGDHTKASDLPVGLIPGTDYSQMMVRLAPSDLLVLYTDGITEAENGFGEQLGQERLRDWAQHSPVDSPAALGAALLSRLDCFRDGMRSDDETLVVLQRLPE